MTNTNLTIKYVSKRFRLSPQLTPCDAQGTASICLCLWLLLSLPLSSFWSSNFRFPRQCCYAHPVIMPYVFLLYKSNKTILMFYEKKFSRGKQLDWQPKYLWCRWRQYVVALSTTLDNQRCIEKPCLFSIVLHNNFGCFRSFSSTL